MLRAVALTSFCLSLRVCTTQQTTRHGRQAANLQAVDRQDQRPSLKLARAHHGSFSVRQSPLAGQWAVAIIGTPVYLACTIAVCGVSFAIATLAAAVSSLSDSPYAMGVDELGDGVAQTCGPPNALSPT